MSPSYHLLVFISSYAQSKHPATSTGACDVEIDELAKEMEWECEACKISVGLNKRMEVESLGQLFIKDDNDTLWVTCARCTRKYHLRHCGKTRDQIREQDFFCPVHSHSQGEYVSVLFF